MLLNPEKARPTGSNVLVRQVAVEEKTSGGIILAEEYQHREEHGQDIGVVIGIGGMAFQIIDEVSGGLVGYDGAPVEGDTVLFRKYSGNRMFDGTDDEKYRFIRADDVIGVIDNDDDE